MFKQFPCRVLGLREEHMTVVSFMVHEINHITPPTRWIGECSPVSLPDYLFFDCVLCAQVRQLTRLLSVSSIPELGSLARRSTAS
ncbi:hypothetical protein PHMEG_00010144 [Phytophthora megakarya]|uniref:Uncharacterized protein n=1 Tax=Phytophthora megakarya TaxID=4795 RepID=A0A225WGG7_9STRA|nr:hypothetical protein PHMEG_00010144 [Phytophthora megakarya]